jgi:hypothetical protein
MHRRFDTVSKVVSIFGDCLRALTPYVTQVGIEWEDGKSYDDWDAITKALYATVVGGTVAYTVEGEGFRELMPYGMVMPDYAGKSFLCSVQFGPKAAFVKLESSKTSFDTALFISLNADGTPTGENMRSRLSDTEFFALLRSADEQREIVNVIVDEKRDLDGR